MSLLDIRDLQTQFVSRGRVFKAVDGVSLTVEEGETVALVGESGCGKSVTALSILGLVPNPPGRIVGGEIWFEGRDLVRLDARSLRGIRGNRIGMIFQEPMTSLNPVFTVGNQIIEAILEHRSPGRRAARRRAAELLDLVGLPEPERLLDEYPHRLSGGMRQRVVIAMALSCEPKLLIADEPTTALDVTTQAQILALLNGLQQRLGMAILIITHDLGVVAQTAHRAAVMYAGRKVEEAAVDALLAGPLHPYTQGLLASLPNPEQDADANRKPSPLKEIPGIVPSLHELPAGCAFAPRCPIAGEDCRGGEIALRSLDARSVACLRADMRVAP
jgi:peptide/nickel transport system ATP-binding protein